MAVDNYVELAGANNALLNWFKSQGLKPHEAVIVIEMFIANLCIANEHCSPIEAKLECITNSIRELIQIKKASMQ